MSSPLAVKPKKKTRHSCERVMKIVINLDVMLARRKMRLKTLAAAINISEQNRILEDTAA